MAILLFKPIFGNKDEFLDCILYSLKPDIISMFQGEYTQDFFKTLKLGIYIFLCVITGFFVSSFFI